MIRLAGICDFAARRVFAIACCRRHPSSFGSLGKGAPLSQWAIDVRMFLVRQGRGVIGFREGENMAFEERNLDSKEPCDKETVRKGKFKHALKWFLGAAVALVVVSIVAWGVGTDWGKVTMHKVDLIGDEAYPMTGTMAIPEGVDDSNPAPVVISMHGAGCSSDTEILHAIEFGRRGYVCICVDTQHAGGLDLYREETWPEIGEKWIDYALSQDWCNGEIIISGMSNGSGMVSRIMSDPEYKSKINCTINIVSYTGLTNYLMHGENPVGVNSLCVDGSGDAAYDVVVNDFNNFLGIDDFQMNTVYGNFEDGSAVEMAWTHCTHPFVYLHPDLYEEVFEFVGQSAPTNTDVAPSDTVFMLYYGIMTVAFILFTIMLASFAYLLSCCPAFYEKIHTRRAAPRVQLPAGKIILFAIIEIIIGILVWFFGVQPFVYALINIPEILRPIFHVQFIGPAMLWVVEVSIINVIVFFVRNRKSKRNGEALTAVDYGTGDEDDPKPFIGSRIGYSALIAVLVVAFGAVWCQCMTSISGLSYTLNSFGMLINTTPDRFWATIPYIIPFGIAAIAMNLGQASIMRFAESKSEIVSFFKEFLINALVLFVPVFFVTFSYVGGQFFNQGGWDATGLPYDWYMGAHPFSLFPFPVMLLMASALNTYLYRKTGNTVLGTMVVIGFLAFFTVSCSIFQPTTIW